MKIEPGYRSRIFLGVIVASCLTGCGEQQNEAEPFPEGTVAVPMQSSDSQPEREAEGAAVVGDVDADLPETQAAAPVTTIEEGEDLPIPEGLSDEIPIMEGFKATRIAATKSTGSYSLNGTLPDALPDIVAFYEEKAQAKGWTKLPGMLQEATAMVNFRKGTRLVQVLIRREEEQSALTITLGDM